jgi:hypothetical protein
MVAPKEAESQLADSMPCAHTAQVGQESQHIWLLELAEYLGCDPHEVNRTARAVMRRKLPLMKLGGQKVAYVTAAVAAQVILRVRMRQGAEAGNPHTGAT